MTRVLVAGVGNIFLGDDGFGVEVARRLASRNLPDDVCVKDFGIRGFDLAYALMDRYELTILVDACARGRAPGTVFLIEPGPVQDAPRFEPHGMTPASVLMLVKSLGGTTGRVLVVGCEPLELGSDEDGRIGLSTPVEAAVDEAIAMIEALVAKAVYA